MSVFNIHNKQPNHIDVILLCSKPNERMGFHGPKCLLNKGTLLRKQIDFVNKCVSSSHFYIVANHMIEMLEEYKQLIPFSIVENNHLEWNDGGEIKIGLNAVLGRNVLIMNGDLLLKQEIPINFNSSFIITGKSPEELSVIGHEDYLENIGYSISDNYWKDCVFIHENDYDKFANCAIQRKKKFLHEIVNMSSLSIQYKIYEANCRRILNNNIYKEELVNENND